MIIFFSFWACSELKFISYVSSKSFWNSFENDMLHFDCCLSPTAEVIQSQKVSNTSSALKIIFRLGISFLCFMSMLLDFLTLLLNRRIYAQWQRQSSRHDKASLPKFSTFPPHKEKKYGESMGWTFLMNQVRYKGQLFWLSSMNSCKSFYRLR